MYKLVLCFLVLSIGFALGVCIGAIYEVSPSKGTITVVELTSLVFTILGGASGIAATGIALYAWSKWKSQSRNNQHYDAKINELRLLNVLELQTANMVTMRANPSSDNFSVIKCELISTLARLNIEMALIEKVATKLPRKEHLDLNELRKLPEVSADVLNLKVWPDKIDTVDYISISSLTNWRYERAKNWFESLEHTPKGVGLREIKVSIINEHLSKLLKESTEELVASL
ncbi:hypothetical protein AB4116_17390 [Vibrio splendidus]|uniref:hypothetical protein n=1 Tax=Vibrio splendidus TaxID=29497 RepID=UPI0003061EFF|nr:hypothetical protein [Vibrio splendidus]OEF33829.1 hypothetical protein A150_19220 [Vibrio splendidus 1S-124]PTQ21846.1 hypothetical protein CWO14_01895 [Vibrio splendidus]